MDSKALRKRLRHQRRQISPKTHARSAIQLCKHLIFLDAIKNASHIGLYLSNDGEISPAEFMHWAWKNSKNCYLPVLNEQANHSMAFAPITQNSKFTPNRFGIPEPVVDENALIAASSLAVILMPLVAFDLNRNRIGMGGGFYDRTLAFTQQHPYYQRPILIGLAHEFQRVDEIKPAQWDIPLDGIVTEQRATLFQQLN